MIVTITALDVYAQPAANQILLGTDLSLGRSRFHQKIDGVTLNDIKYTTVSFNQKAAKFLSDKLAVGASVGFSYQSNNYSPADSKANMFIFAVGPFCRYYFSAGKAGFFTQAYVAMVIGKRKSEYVEVTKSNITTFNAGIAPGVYYYITPKLTLEGMFGLLGIDYTVYKTGDSKDMYTHYGLDLSSSTLSFGLTYTL